jgi:hypothetical protein
LRFGRGFGLRLSQSAKDNRLAHQSPQVRSSDALCNPAHPPSFGNEQLRRKYRQFASPVYDAKEEDIRDPSKTIFCRRAASDGRRPFRNRHAKS